MVLWRHHGAPAHDGERLLKKALQHFREHHPPAVELVNPWCMLSTFRQKTVIVRYLRIGAERTGAGHTARRVLVGFVFCRDDFISEQQSGCVYWRAPPATMSV